MADISTGVELKIQNGWMDTFLEYVIKVWY